MIRGYARLPSLFPGQILTLHISTDRPLFRVDLYRYDTELSLMSRSEWLEGHNAPVPATLEARTRDWNWPAYEFPIPEECQSGVYIAVLVEREEGQGKEMPITSVPLHAKFGRALFVLKSAAPGTESTIL